MKARVFISCGQRTEIERMIVTQIRDLLIDRKYDPYVAIYDHTLRGLKENIFQQLRTSEYFLFIDFKREGLVNETSYRGSLFSHQELAIAAYLNLDVLAFREAGVKYPDGMLHIVQANAIEFSDPEELPNLIVRHLTKWNPVHKNLLSIEISPTSGQNWAVGRDPNQLVHIFHLLVRNHSQFQIALHCSAYLSQCINEETGQPINYQQAELKWAGVNFPSVNLFPGSSRILDGVWIHHSQPTIGIVYALTDSDLYVPRCQGPGKYRLDYTVLSENLLPVSRQFRLTLGHTVKEARFDPIENPKLLEQL